MSDRQSDGEQTRADAETQHASREVAEGASPGSVGALDGAAAAGSLGAVGSSPDDGALPTHAPDPSVGPD